MEHMLRECVCNDKNSNEIAFPQFVFGVRLNLLVARNNILNTPMPDKIGIKYSVRSGISD